ncbi:MAG: hypothetical protein R3C59_17610 [Planctomycetaceae bacterium]
MSTHLISICLAALLCSTAFAHPVSHTDAWIRVSDSVVHVKLNVFLDDVARHQVSGEQQTQITASELQQAIRQHTGTLLHQLHIFDQNGLPLSVQVTSIPEWTPHAETVDLTADSSLKLSWELEFAVPPTGLTALCFLHQFTHPTLTAPGELRLHVQHSGRRIDAVIAPGRPHTILLPTNADTGDAEPLNPNAASSLLIMSPTGIVHEFTAPLLLLDAAWPPAAELRRQSTDVNIGEAPNLTDAAIPDSSRQQIKDWFLNQTAILVNGRKVMPLDVGVDFFPADGPSADGSLSTSVEQQPVPLFGTQVGVQLRFPRASDLQTLQLEFLSAPGLFSELTVGVVTSTQQMSELVSFGSESPDFAGAETDAGNANSGAEAADKAVALTFVWHAPSADVESNVLLTKPVTEDDRFMQDAVMPDLLTVRHHQPALPGRVLAVLAIGLIGVATWRRSRCTRRSHRMVWLAIGIIVAVAGVLLLPRTIVQFHPNVASRLTESLLRRVYESAMQPSEETAVAELSQVLHDDLVESVYVQMLESLSMSSNDGLLIDVQKVSLESQHLQPALTTPDEVTTACRWRVTGSIHHWGHRHVRELLLEAQIRLSRSGSDWKIGAIQQLDTHVVSLESAKAGS